MKSRTSTAVNTSRFLSFCRRPKAVVCPALRLRGSVETRSVFVRPPSAGLLAPIRLRSGSRWLVGGAGCRSDGEEAGRRMTRPQRARWTTRQKPSRSSTMPRCRRRGEQLLRTGRVALVVGRSFAGARSTVVIACPTRALFVVIIIVVFFFSLPVPDKCVHREPSSVSVFLFHYSSPRIHSLFSRLRRAAQLSNIANRDYGARFFVDDSFFAFLSSTWAISVATQRTR